MLAALNKASYPSCGLATWLLKPSTSILKMSQEALAGPGVAINFPTGTPESSNNIREIKLSKHFYFLIITTH